MNGLGMDCWVTQEGEAIAFEDMATTHLFYSIRMVFNHSAPAILQIPGCRRYKLDWTPNQRQLAIKLLVAELKKRDPSDLAPWQWTQLRYMADAVKEFQTLKLMNENRQRN